ncbi:MAG TPA: HAD-IA family hydrolase [Christensenellaceae bacterium]|jgi:HAD superfamily hydrolase (TIGR01549 family)|nr:HAD-IA family hydrolase [Christensenellaceae bacterium]
MIFSHFIWDFDGTLFNSYPLMAEDLAMALKSLLLPVPSEKAILEKLKATLKSAALVFANGDENLTQEILSKYAYYADKRNAKNIPLYPGAEDCLVKIVSQGGSNYIFTHRDKSAIKALESKNLSPLFAHCITKEHAFPRKPSADALNHIIDKYNIDKKRCCMIGDRPLDMECAKNADIAAIMFDPENFYPSYRADFRFGDFTTLTEYLV